MCPPSCQPQEHQHADPMAQPAPGQTGLAGALRADVGTKLISKFPQLPKAGGLQFGQSRGSLRGRCWHGGTLPSLRDREGRVSSVISPQTAAAGPWLRPSPGQGRGAALHHRRPPLSPGPLFSPFFFPLPSGKQYLSAYIMLASPERPAASAADLSPLLRTVPGGAGGNERRSRAQGPSGSHGAWPGPSPAPAGNTRPRPHAVPGMGSLCWEQWCIPSPRNLPQPPGMGTPVLHSPHCPGGQTRAVPVPALPFPALTPTAGHGPAVLPALPPPWLPPARCGWPDPPPTRPLPSWAVPRPGLSAPGHGANLLPLPAVLPGAGAGALPAPFPSLHCLRGSLFLQAGWVPQQQGAWGMCAAAGSGDGC